VEFFNPNSPATVRVTKSARKPHRRARGTAFLWAAALWLGVALHAGAAMPQPPAPKTAPPATSPIVALDWKDLAPAQREALSPLEATWPKLSAGQKRKWIAVVQNFTQLAEPERVKLHNRMAQWAALKPRERDAARLNFAATKKLTPAEKAANWEAYQALSPEDKKGLAKKSRPLANTTALAPKPASSGVITPVPITRLSTQAQREKVAAQQAIDPHTLLPLAPKY
jgi:hypothetical protein